jgi:transcriptional accessory protein Tex/SPT6
MYKWTIEPTKKIGKIIFGMEKKEIRDIFSEYKEFKKTKYSKNTTDDFGLFHVYYNKENKCEAVEIFEDVEIFIDNNKIFPGTILNAINILKKRDTNIEIETDSCISVELSIGIYAPNGQIESILFGKEGYYD